MPNSNLIHPIFPKRFVMLLAFLSMILIPLSFAQTELDFYIQKFRYKPLAIQAKNQPLYALGFKLFYDKNLSGKNNISCQSCHSLSGYSGDALPLALGEGAVGLADKRTQQNGLVIGRHTPAIYNLGHPEVKSLFWDGRVMKKQGGGWITPIPLKSEVANTLSSILAVQSIFPLTSPEEMLGKESKLTPHEAWDLVLRKIFEGPFKATYGKMFKDAFPNETDFNVGHVGNALAELMRHHFSATNTLWDLYLRGTEEALSSRMKKGAVLFHTKASCFECHNGDHFSTWGFQNIGIPQLGNDDRGRFNVTKNDADLYKFRVTPLRNVGLTAPYMHSGVFKTLWEVIDHYDDPISNLRNFNWNPRHPSYHDPLNLDRDPINQHNRESNLSPKLPRSLGLTAEEKGDLFCFLAVALTDVSLQMDLIKKGILNEISDCAPRPF
jgi:cytochrome c peroxidase